MPRTMTYKDEDGTKYKISYSEELQLKNLRATKRQVVWEKRNFYVKVLLLIVIAILTATILFVLYRLDTVNFFTQVMYR